MKYLINEELSKFNGTIDYLINAFTKYNLDEHALLFLAKRTKRFMTFTHVIVLHILFRVLKTFSGAKNIFDKYILDTNQMVDDAFKQIEDSLNNILSNKMGISNQDDIDNIISNLKFIKKIITNLTEMALSVLKYQSNVINEDEFREEYRKFKEKFENDKNEFSTEVQHEVKKE